MTEGVPLVIPEVNPEAMAHVKIGGGGAIVANPNCSTIIALMAVTPLHKLGKVGGGPKHGGFGAVWGLGGWVGGWVARFNGEGGSTGYTGHNPTQPRAASNVIDAIGCQAAQRPRGPSPPPLPHRPPG